MLYVIYAQDNQNSLEKRLSVRPAHLARLQLLHDEGRLLTAGPMPAVDSNDPGAAGFTGSTVIAEFDSLEDVFIGHRMRCPVHSEAMDRKQQRVTLLVQDTFSD